MQFGYKRFISTFLDKKVESICLFVLGATALIGPGPPRFRGFLITHNDAPQSVGLLWTSDQLVAEISTRQHTKLTTNEHPCPQWYSNPQSQQASGRKPTPWTARPLGPIKYMGRDQSSVGRLVWLRYAASWASS